MGEIWTECWKIFAKRFETYGYDQISSICENSNYLVLKQNSDEFLKNVMKNMLLLNFIEQFFTNNREELKFA